MQCGCNRSIADIDWLLKARLKTLNRHWQALAPVRHCISTPAARFRACRKKKSPKSSTVRDCLLVHFAIEPSGKHPCVRQATLGGQVVTKNDDNVRSHLPYRSPIVDHTFVWGGREGVKCHMKVLSFVRDVWTFEMTPKFPHFYTQVYALRLCNLLHNQTRMASYLKSKIQVRLFGNLESAHLICPVLPSQLHEQYTCRGAVSSFSVDIGVQ